jgi:hypothetical protein
MSTYQQDKDFGSVFLEQIIDWASDYLEVGDVFTLDQIKEYVKGYDPEDIFSYDDLVAWAGREGFEKV